MNPWFLFWSVLTVAMVPFALIYGGYNIFTVLGVMFLGLAALVGWYRPGVRRGR